MSHHRVVEWWAAGPLPLSAGTIAWFGHMNVVLTTATLLVGLAGGIWGLVRMYKSGEKERKGE